MVVVAALLGQGDGVALVAKEEEDPGVTMAVQLVLALVWKVATKAEVTAVDAPAVLRRAVSS